MYRMKLEDKSFLFLYLQEQWDLRSPCGLNSLTNCWFSSLKLGICLFFQTVKFICLIHKVASIQPADQQCKTGTPQYSKHNGNSGISLAFFKSDELKERDVGTEPNWLRPLCSRTNKRSIPDWKMDWWSSLVTQPVSWSFWNIQQKLKYFGAMLHDTSQSRSAIHVPRLWLAELSGRM